MNHIAIYNIKAHLVEGIESYDNPRDLGTRLEGYEIERCQRGPDWRVYCGDAPFSWDAVDHKPTPAEAAASRIVKIRQRFPEIDLESIPYLRSFAAKTITEPETAALAALESEAIALRAEMAELAKVAP